MSHILNRTTPDIQSSYYDKMLKLGDQITVSILSWNPQNDFRELAYSICIIKVYVLNSITLMTLIDILTMWPIVQ